MQKDCVFCKIVSGEIPSEKVLETEHCIVIKDINPQAPVHLLVITKEHFDDITQVRDREIAADIIDAINEVAEKLNLRDFRVVNNRGRGAGQSVFHVHFHILAGRPFSWPPG